MLPLPDANNNIATIVGIDPGTTKLGFALLHYNVDNFEIVGCEAETLLGEKLPGSDWLESMYGSRFRRIEAYRSALKYRFDIANPVIIASESPFINVKRPAAYGALTEIVYAIKLAVVEHNSWRPLHLLPPSMVKNAVGAKGNADKDAMRIALNKLFVIASTCTKDTSQLDEHSIDALAVAYCAWLQNKEGKLELIQI